MKVKLQVRPPAVAGAFYPEDKELLRSQIREFLDNVPQKGVEGKLRILIVPHAGYSYSGQVAAFGFRQVQGKDFSRVIIVGGSHRARFFEIAADGSTHWQTPLGRVAVDTDPNIIENSQVHAVEHSLEVEVPFLQHVLNQFKIVPILLGDNANELAQATADTLSQHLDGSTLIVISTDLSHYPSYDDAKKVDQKTIEAILTGRVAEFTRVIAEQMAQGIPNLATCACGEGAVKAGMFLAESLRGGEWKLLKYANSGDIIGGDKSQVVGYVSIGYYQKNSKLQLKSQNELLHVARTSLENYLAGKNNPRFEIENNELNQNLGAFVTLRKNGQLRGCLGEFEPGRPLWRVVREKAIDAALHDPRFLPVTAEELSDIKIEISVLSPRQKISGPNKIELGKHGVVIQKGSHSGVFLPQVATETGWDLETFLSQLCSQKAGLSRDCWKDKKVQLYTFTAQVFTENSAEIKG